MNSLIRRIPWSRENIQNTEPLLTREWLVANGLGGYSSGTVSGAATRRYHGLLIAALPAPFGRTVMLNHLSEQLRLPNGSVIRIGGEEYSGGVLELAGAPYHTEFRLDTGLPVWRYEIDGFVIEKTLFLLHLQNTVQITYRMISGNGILRLKLRPSVNFRSHDAPVNIALTEPYLLTSWGNCLELSSDKQLPPLRMTLYGQYRKFTLEGKRIQNIFYRIESHRGYEDTGDLWSPGYFAVDLSLGAEANFVASTESWETIFSLSPEDAFKIEQERRSILLDRAHPHAKTGLAAELVLAADQFVIAPAGRVEATAFAHAVGDEARTVIAGYHWFTDWGRDTMISLEGLTLITGRHLEASWILRTFAHYIRQGLLPNMFPEGKNEGLYNTADATLWFFHAIHRYLHITNDRATLQIILPQLVEIAEHHLRGTQFGIQVDPKDGLLQQGLQGFALSWMDAKVGDWVVTPRRGKAVEINALWYNALCLLEGWLREEGDDKSAQRFAQAALKTKKSFNERFWYGAGGYLYDIVDGEQGDDSACRPNQILAISLTHPILDSHRWQAVVDIVSKKLLTPVGLRSLAPDHPDYKAKYYGDLRARDAAYHQGTVWAWLIGPFIDAWLTVYPEDCLGASRFLEGFKAHLNEACIGSISEVFDAEEPFTPRGCIAQAWSVAEVLRCLILTAET